MSNEFLIAKGKLAELQEKYKEYELKAESLLIQIRELLTPYTDFIDLDLERVLLLTKEFRELQLKTRDCLKGIGQIKNIYNI